MADPTATAGSPRFIKDANSPTVYDTIGGYLDPISNMEDLHARDPNASIATIGNVQDYFPNLYKQQATALYQPTLDNADNSLKIGNAQIDQATTDANRQYDTLGQQLADAAKAATGNIQADVGRYGFLGTGAEQAGLGKVQSDLSKNKANAAADRASQLAQLALQRAGLANTVAGQKASATQNIQDMVSKLLAGTTAAQQNAMQIASTIPIGQTVNVGGQLIHGTMQPKLTQLDLGNKIVSVDSAGNIVNSYTKGLTPSASVVSGFASTGGTASNLSQDIQDAMSKGGVNREQLITALANKYASSKTITPAEIATAVYSQIRGPQEGPFTGLSKSAMDFVNSLSGKAGSSGTSAAQDSARSGLISALSALDTAIQNPGFGAGLKGFSALVPGIGQYLNKNGYAYEATKTDLASQLAKAITGGSRPSAQVIQGYMNSLPSVTDTPAIASQKLDNLRKQILNQANAQGFSDIVSKYSTPSGNQAPTTGKTASGISFTVIP